MFNLLIIVKIRKYKCLTSSLDVCGLDIVLETSNITTFDRLNMYSVFHGALPQIFIFNPIINQFQPNFWRNSSQLLISLPRSHSQTFYQAATISENYFKDNLSMLCLLIALDSKNCGGKRGAA